MGGSLIMAMTLITNSADTDSTDLTAISFTSSIDSTYKLFIFKFIDINPVTDNAFFQFQANAAGASGYNETITSAIFIAYANEGNSDNAIQYVHDSGSDYDQAQGTGYQQLCTIGNGADESASGELLLFNPSNTTYIKHFYSTAASYHGSNYARNMRVGGYFNTTTAIDDIQFKMSSGNFDGTIKLYGIG